MDGKIIKLEEKENKLKAKLDDVRGKREKLEKKLARLKAEEKRKEMRERVDRRKITYAYGQWALDNIEMPMAVPNTFEEAVLDINALYDFLGCQRESAPVFNEKYFRPGYSMVVLGAEIKQLVEKQILSCPYCCPKTKTELQANISFLKEKYPSQAKEYNLNDYDFDCLIPDRIYSLREMHEIGFPFDGFSVPDKEMEFTGELVARMWAARHPQLICFFVSDEGKGYRLNLWWKGNDKDYCPRHTPICFKNVETQTVWKCTVGLTRTGKVVWDTAEAMEGYYEQS